jgi:predicted RNase H-like HicB family nuclease
MNELVFEVTQESDGGFVAECLSESIITQADTWMELRKNVQEAITAYYFDKPRPSTVRLHI